MFMFERTKRGKRRLHPEYLAWRDKAGWILKMQMVGVSRIDCRFSVEIEVPISRIDLDNHIKPLLDLLTNMGVIADDANVAGIQIRPMVRTDCAVCITPLPAMGGVRKPASVPWRQSRPIKARPTQRQLDLVSALHAKVRFRWTIPRAHRVRP
jgi:Holliday junction resolvase RusA-like endonuclease